MVLWSCTVVVLSLSCVQLFITMWTAARQSSLSITNSRSLLKLMSIELVMPSNHPLPSPSLPTFNLSQHQGLFQWVSSSHQVAKELELQFSLSPSKEYSGMISFGFDWLDLLSVQGTLKSLLQPPQFKSINSSILSFLYGPTLPSIRDYWKTICLTIQTFVSKVMSLLFNMLSRLVIAFLPRNKYFLKSWLSTVTLESEKIKSLTVSFVSPTICNEVMGPDAMIFVFWMLSFKPAFSLSPLSRSSSGSLVPLHFLQLEW